ncbi:MAG: twin-arginine translocation signal domain-containing protein, partial [Pseudomonadota bacterium]
MTTRRSFIRGAAAGVLGLGLVSRTGAASLPEAPSMDKPTTQPPLAPPS